MKSVVDLFCGMVRVDSESGNEGPFVQYARDLLESELGAICELDMAVTPLGPDTKRDG